jgi:hypothetical protein
LEALHIEHVGGERDGAGVRDARAPIAADEPEQRIDAAHPRPRQGAVEQCRRVAPNRLAGLLGLTA